MALTFVHSNGTKPTTRGLSSLETVELFYSAMNTLDVSAAEVCVTGNKVNGIIDVMSNIYVSGKARSAYEPREELVTPAAWLSFNSDGSYNIYGLTQFAVDSEKRSLFAEGPAVNTHPRPLAEEGGVPLRDGAVKEYVATYFLIFSENEQTLRITEKADTVHLVFKKDRWLVSQVESRELSDGTADFEAFIAAWKAASQVADDDVLLLANALRESYPWLSTNSEILDAAAWLMARSPF